MTKIIAKEYTEFLEQLKEHIATSRYKAARTVNKELLILYHYIGTQILEKQKNQDWGFKVIEQLGRDLRAGFPEMKGFGIANLHNMRRFAELYPNPEFLQQVAGILPWYHHVVLMERVKDHEARLFYIRNASEYGWSRAIMIHQIELGLHKRQGKVVTNFREKLSYPTSDLANQTIKNPYIFDLLSIGKDAHEREIEKGLAAHIEKFLLELGAGFSFVGRQYHLTVRQKDYYLDLLFYHLKLRCFVVIEIKAVEFEPEHSGKMNFYLSMVDDLLKHPTDNLSIGLILCKSKDNVLAEYALRDMTKPIGLAEYQITKNLPEEIKTALPTIEELEAELSKISDKEESVNVTVDLSHWKENVNFKLVKENGILGVIHKATQGLKYVDPTYAKRRKAAEEEGLLWGAYHFGVGENGKDQAEHFLETVGNSSGVLLALDIEENRNGKNITPKQAEDFVNRVKEVTGRFPLIYGSAYFLKDFATPILTKCPLWVARWGAEPLLPKGWNNWVLWQYTDGQTGQKPHSVEGIGPCDRNKFNGTLEELKDFWM
jgi:predicted nuclease of restriction endonuclease-like (RecB) superfamily/GH25 family lysozyme M1 (1,4-beta-N-acetylmuramidase)